MSYIKSEPIDEPGTSFENEQDLYDDSLTSDASKRRLKTALDYTLRRLIEENLIATESSSVVTEEHVELGNKIYEKIMEVLSEYTFAYDEELIWSGEVDERGEYEEVDERGEYGEVDERGEYEETDGDRSSGDEYVPDEKEMREDLDFLPLDYKRMVVNLAKAHPRWSLKTLRSRGAYRLKHMKVLKRWEEQVKNGGTRYDKCNIIDKWAYDRFVEARTRNQKVTTKNLQKWALDAASQFPDLEFKASKAWAHRFKQKYKIRQRKVTRIVSDKKVITTTLSSPVIKQDMDTS